MPLITVKMWPGRTEEQKRNAAQALLDAAVEALGTPATAFTVIVEEIPREEWNDRVTIPEIEPKGDLVMIRQGVSTKV